MKEQFKKIYLAFIYICLYFPILVLMLFSLNKARFSLQWHGFSTRWYQELLDDHGLWSAFLNSVYLGVSAAIFASIMSTMVCVYFFLHRGSNPKHRPFFLMLLLLIIIPDLVLGVALLVFYNILSLPLGFFSLWIAHVTFCIPFAILTIHSRIHTLDINIYYSALDLGATHYQALQKVIMPILWPAVLSAFLLCFILSFDDVIISYFIAGPDFNILPLTIYSLVRVGVTPELNALCSIIFLMSMILVIIAHFTARKPICHS